MKINTSLLFCLFLLWVLPSCKKDDAVTDLPDAAIDCMYAEDAFTDVFSICRDVELNPGAFSGIASTAGVTVSYDTLNPSDPDTIVVDFGTTSIPCTDSRFRRGKIILTTSGNYTDSLHRTIVAFDHFYYGNDFVNGNDTIWNHGIDTLTGTHLFKTITKAYLLINGSSAIYWTSYKDIHIVAGDSTATMNDDVYSVNGDANGTQYSNGNPFYGHITNTLVKNQNTGCNRYFNSGLLAVQPLNHTAIQLFLGYGSCDSIATAVIGGETTTVGLH